VEETLAGLGGRASIRRAPAAETSDADWDAVMELDPAAVFRLARAAGRHMLASGRGGRIVNAVKDGG
jgi:2-deoxy-D-gluconate 3-dehydrogenase